MHLQQLKIRNLASLRGEHVIDFEVLGSQDLFAITGETGAGKSTLLNAIALALYGRVYRSQTYSTDYVTLGEKDASVDLFFSVRGIRYWVKWSITALKRDGTPVSKPKPNRSVYKFEQDEFRIQEIDPQEILGLDFDQFSKCVVLNQGEFARFLTATFSERRGILEKLYPSDNLDAVGGLARKRFERESERLKTIEIQIHGLSSETLFDVTAAREQLAVHEKTYQETQGRLLKMRPWKQGIEELMVLAQKFADTQGRFQQLELELSHKTEIFNSSMNAWQKQQKELESAQAKFDAELPGLELDDREARALIPLQTALTEKQKSLAEETQRSQKIRQRLETQTQQSQQVADELKSLTGQLAPRAMELLRCDWKALEALQTEAPLIEQRTRDIEKHLAEAALRGKQLAGELKSLDEKIATLNTALPEAYQALAPQERKAQLTSARENFTRTELLLSQKTRIEAQAQQLKTDIAAAEPQLTRLTLERENQRLRRALREVKQHMGHAPSAHCPLCQQTVIDWGQLLSSPDEESEFKDEEFNRVSKEQDKRRTLLQQLEMDLQALPVTGQSVTLAVLDELSQMLDEVNRLAQERSSLDARLAEARQSWLTLQERKLMLESETKEHLSRRDRSLAELARLLERELAWTPMLFTELSQERERARRASELERMSAQMTSQLVDWRREMQESGEKMARLELELKELTEEVRLRQTALDLKYPKSSPLEVLKQRQEELKLLLHRTHLLQQEFRQKELALGDARANLGRVQEQLHQVELYFADQKSRLAQHREIAVTIADARNILPPLLLQIQNDITQEELKGREADQARGQLSTLLSEDQKRREKLSLLAQQRALATKESERWQRLLDVLGTDDMRTFVLSLVEAALVEQTNLELQRLCSGRYEIQHSHRRDRPEFWVIDRWRDGLLRKVTTLSGGETFMVSLAMALALAEMARGRADIDCFFIDEGFGTLDENSLEDVMDMLQQVRSRGKQIGIITHVKALSSRLPLNLVVTKNSRGNSSLEIVYA
ncbi:MAG: AAA family ATPase [Bacteriovoracia bacterium]